MLLTLINTVRLPGSLELSLSLTLLAEKGTTVAGSTLQQKKGRVETSVSSRKSTEDSLEGKLIDSFGALPDIEQADIIHRLDKLRETCGQYALQLSH